MKNTHYCVNSMISTIILYIASSLIYANAAIHTVKCNEQTGKLNDVFGEFSTQFSGDTTLVTTEIFSGFSEFTDKKNTGKWYKEPVPKALGMRVTSSLQATDAKSEDYANASLLLRDGALLGITLSFMASPRWNHYLNMNNCDASASPYRRDFRTDKIYLASHPIENSFLKAYFVHGITLKALRASLSNEEESADDENDGIHAGANFYFGLGFDGFLTKLGDEATVGSIAGIIDFRLGIQRTLISKSALQNIYNDTTIDEDNFTSSFGKLTVHVTDKFSIEIEHVSPFSDHTFMSDVTAFRLGYSIGRP